MIIRQVLSFFLLLFSVAVVAQVKPLPNAHAHNDYEHTRPLWDALAQGFTSVEADVHLINGELYVAHDSPKEALPGRTLKELYLKPLQKIVFQNKGKVYPGFEGTFYLMIDFKTAAEATYRVLEAQLKQFPELQSNPHVVIFISGNRPVETIRNASAAVALLDGRPEDIAKNVPTDRMPVISESFYKVCRWNGKDPIPDAEFQKLKTLAAQVHAQGKKLRLWATPDQPDAWKVLLEAGVDLVNTDKLEDLRKFLEEYPATRK